ncbi:GIY-YIG nuclease family protein [Candidatus Peregrinibacteria bacterium]|nr:GIY-YIG nuclease family protein [Candidatus Peregrinibacteria bacterium]
MQRIGVYILEGRRFYVGSTTDLDRRLLQHEKGHTHTTKRIGKWVLKKFFPCASVSEARTLEAQIKKSKNISRWLTE